MALNKNKNSKAKPTEMEDTSNQPEVSSLFVRMLEAKKMDKNVDVTDMRIKNINRYLKSTQNYRQLGLIALSDFLDLHSVVSAIFTKEKDCQELEWIELMLKMIDQKQEPAEKCFPILNKLLIITTQNPDMHKIIQGKYIQKIIESVTGNAASVPSFETLMTCLKSFSGTSGIYKNKIYDFCIALVDSSNIALVQLAGKSLHLIQQTRGGSVAGSAYRKNWAEFHEKLLNTIDDEFSQLLGAGETSTGKSERLKLPETNFSSDKKSQMPLMYTQHERYIRFRNLCIFLECGLLQAFPVPKTIQLNRIISNLIDKGSALNQSHLNKKDGDSHLPYILHVEIQKCFINLLRNVILAVGGNILIQSKDISDILWKSLKSTNIAYDELKVDGNSSLRCSIYSTLITFLKSTPNNHFINKHMENLMKEAFIDITPIQNEITLTLPNEVGKSKKKKRKTEIRKNINGAAVDVCLNLHQMLCGKALEFLRNMLSFCGAGMKSVLLKILQEKILLTTFKFMSHDLTENDLYNSFECRLQMLELCFAILMHPAIRNATPSSYSIEILTQFKENDRDLRLRQRAAELIRNLEPVLHNRKDPIHFPSDLHEFRDTWLFNEKTVKAFKQLKSEMWKKQQVQVAANGHSSVAEEIKMVVEEEETEKNSNEVVEIIEENENSSDVEEVQAKDDSDVEILEDEKSNDSDVEFQDEDIPPMRLKSPEKASKRISLSDNEVTPLKVPKYSENKEDDEIVDSYLADFEM